LPHVDRKEVTSDESSEADEFRARSVTHSSAVCLAIPGIRAALWDDVGVGMMLAAYSLWRALEIEELTVSNWIVDALGLWALSSPFALHF